MFAERLKDLRLENGFTQKQIADILGVDRSTYAYYELSRTRPDIETLVVLAKLFKVTTDYLLVGSTLNKDAILNESSEKYERSSSCVHSGDLSKDERELILYYRMLNVASKNAIRQAAKEKYAEVAKEYDELLK